MASGARAIAFVLVGSMLGLLGCTGLVRSAQRSVRPPAAFRAEPIVKTTRFALPRPALARLAVAPLAASGDPQPATGLPPEQVVHALLVEELSSRGAALVPASDLQVLLGDARLDHRTAARAAAELGATGVLVGRVQRFRERQGGPFAVKRPASVGFEVTLHSAPDGRRLWTGRFSHTQQSSDTNPLDAARYPGGGTRWLSAEELARWGAENVVEELLAQR